jgi:HEPN domain-containing protein
MTGRASGHFVLRIDPELHRTLRREAAARDLSLNAYCTTLLQRRSAATAPRRDAQAFPWLEDVERAVGSELVGVVLFGSRARGDALEGSDTDLLVVLEPGSPLNRARYDQWETRFGAESSPHFVTLPATGEEFGSIWLEAAVDGTIVQDRGARVAALLVSIRREIAAGRYRRAMAYGHPYWTREARREADAADYLKRASSRLAAIDVLMEKQSWADVVRESQEVVEIVLKALLRISRIEVPQIHDVSPILLDNRERLPAAVRLSLDELVSASRSLRRDRELAFYGSEDLTPSDFYRREDAERALAMARRTHGVVSQAAGGGG